MKKAVLFIVAVSLLSACGLNTSPGTGEKVGQIVRLSNLGMIRQTCEGQIIRGGFQTGSGTMGAAFEFTIEDPNLCHKAEEFMQAQTEVRLSYRSEGVYSLMRTESSGHFATAIEPLEAGQ